MLVHPGRLGTIMAAGRPHGAREVSVLYSVRDGYQSGGMGAGGPDGAPAGRGTLGVAKAFKGDVT